MRIKPRVLAVITTMHLDLILRQRKGIGLMKKPVVMDWQSQRSLAVIASGRLIGIKVGGDDGLTLCSNVDVRTVSISFLASAAGWRR